jgi:hypothetical protein
MPLRWQTNTAVKTANYTAAPGDLVRCDPSGGAFAVTLPTVAGDDRMIVIKNVTTSTNAITITPDGSDTIDLAASLVMDVGLQAIILIPDGVTNWMVI